MTNATFFWWAGGRWRKLGAAGEEGLSRRWLKSRRLWQAVQRPLNVDIFGEQAGGRKLRAIGLAKIKVDIFRGRLVSGRLHG